MAWNGSGRDKAKAGGEREPHSATSTFHFNLKALLAGLIVVVVSATALVFFRQEQPQVSDQPMPKTSAIKEVAPQIAQVQTNEEVAVEKELPHHVGEMWFREDGQKMITLKRNGQIVDMPVQVRKGGPMAKTRIFPHRSENMIANLLRIEPGQGVFGISTYKGFKDDFLKSLTVPIIPTKDDDEWTQKLKRDVNEAKIELKAAYDRGEDIEEIMRNTREEYKKLAVVKSQLQSEVYKEIHKEGTTIQDIADIKAAANKMLADKGIAPLKLNPIIEKKLAELKEGGKK